jgi:23S rRNA A1618 N6-methylase RlmF
MVKHTHTRIYIYIYIAHETAICCNPPFHNFTEDRKNRSLIDHYLSAVMFLRKYKEREFSCGHNTFDRICVCNLTVG